MGIASSMEYPAYPGYAPQTTTGIDQRHSPTPSLTLSTSTRDSSSLDGSPDMLARYRAEQLLRSNTAPGVNLPGIGSIAGSAYPGTTANANQLGLAATTSSQSVYPPPSTTAGGLTGLYHNSNSAWQHSQAAYSTADPIRKDYSTSGRMPFPASLSQSQQQLGSSAPNAAPDGYPGYHPNVTGSQYSFRDSQQQERPHTRAGSEDSVTNSSVDDYGNGRPHTSHAYPSGSSSPSRQQHQQQQAHEQQNHQQDFYAQARRGSLPQDGEGGFSSAFGLLSLDDPAVLAGLQSDGTPFFSDIHPTSQGPGNAPAVGAASSSTGDRSQRSSFSSTGSFSANESGPSQGSSQTSLISVDQDGNVNVSNHHLERPLSQPHFGAQDQQHQGSSSGLPFPSLPTPGSSKEDLKEFWRQYLKTPLTGPSGGTGFTPLFGPSSAMGGLITPTASGEHMQLGFGLGGEHRPQLSPTRRHSRVASLPSMKTPTIAMNEWLFNAGTSSSSSSTTQTQTAQQQQDNQPSQSHQQGMFGFAGIPPQFNLHMGSKGSLRKDKMSVENTPQQPHQTPLPQEHPAERPVAQSHVERQMAQNANGSANDDDLDSYKQAVLARKAPTQLHLAPRKRGKTIHSGLLMGGTGSKGLVEGTLIGSPPIGTQALPSMSKTISADGYARSGSAASSSLADAFGRQRQTSEGSAGGSDSPTPGPGHGHQFLQPPPPPFHLTRQPPQRSTASMSPTISTNTISTSATHTQASTSSTSPDSLYPGSKHDYANSASSQGSSAAAYRPSFKRLASQTLGPENSKRALLGPAGWDDEIDVASEEDENSSRGTSSRGASEGREATVVVVV